MAKRALLKLSGETLSGEGLSINPSSLKKISDEIKDALSPGDIELAIVVGAGNLWRGASKDMDRVIADKIGMLATTMNGLALKDELLRSGLKAETFAPRSISGLVREYDNEKVQRHLRKGGIAIITGGTGNPFFTTDSGAALRASEIKAQIILKATQIDGVYDDDPKKNPKAVKFERLTFNEAIEKRLKIMDAAAFAISAEANISVLVFDFHKSGNLRKALSGEKIGTLVKN